jgi:hypothetical protein
MGFVIQEIRDLAKGQACVCCGIRDDTVVACHYQGLRSHSLGKGTGMKPHDLFVAYLCTSCHRKFDSYEGSSYDDPFMRKIENSETFLFHILKTWELLYIQGKIKIIK